MTLVKEHKKMRTLNLFLKKFDDDIENIILITFYYTPNILRQLTTMLEHTLRACSLYFIKLFLELTIQAYSLFLASNFLSSQPVCLIPIRYSKIHKMLLLIRLQYKH